MPLQMAVHCKSKLNKKNMALKAKLNFGVENEQPEWYTHQKHYENESNN
jgi:hypothetical protein